MSNNGATQPVSVRQMSRLLKRFALHDGDILAIKYQTENANRDAIDVIAKAFSQMEMTNVLVIVVNNFDDLSVLNETAMNARGWYRLKTLQRVMNHGKPEAEATQDE
jgi:hypothetical protein